MTSPLIYEPGVVGRHPLGEDCSTGPNGELLATQQNAYARYTYVFPPWAVIPWDGTPFDPFGIITTPAANGIETVVLQFQIPVGHDGIIKAVMNIFTGPGFDEGSGNLIWRIRRGPPGLLGAPFRNYSNIQNTMGSLITPREVAGGLVVTSGQFIVYTVTHALLSPIVPAGTRILVNIRGWYWPKGLDKK